MAYSLRMIAHHIMNTKRNLIENFVVIWGHEIASITHLVTRPNHRLDGNYFFVMHWTSAAKEIESAIGDHQWSPVFSTFSPFDSWLLILSSSFLICTLNSPLYRKSINYWLMHLAESEQARGRDHEKAKERETDSTSITIIFIRVQTMRANSIFVLVKCLRSIAPLPHNIQLLLCSFSFHHCCCLSASHFRL